jgi:hypothetical protein
MSNSALATACWLKDWVNQPCRKLLPPPALIPLLTRPRQSSPVSNSRIRLISAYPLRDHPPFADRDPWLQTSANHSMHIARPSWSGSVQSIFRPPARRSAFAAPRESCGAGPLREKCSALWSDRRDALTVG